MKQKYTENHTRKKILIICFPVRGSERPLRPALVLSGFGRRLWNLSL